MLVDADEDESGVRLDAQRSKAVVLTIELRLLVGLRVGHADELAFKVVGPIVVDAPDRDAGVATPLSGEHGAPVGTAVVKGAQLHLSVAPDDHGLLADRRTHEVARLLQLGLMRHELPGAIEDLLELGLVDLLGVVDAPVDDLRHVHSQMWFRRSDHFSPPKLPLRARGAAPRVRLPDKRAL